MWPVCATNSEQGVVPHRHLMNVYIDALICAHCTRWTADGMCPLSVDRCLSMGSRPSSGKKYETGARPTHWAVLCALDPLRRTV